MSALIQLTKVSKSYQRGPEKIEVLRDVTMDIQGGEFLALMGPSGSGKTTLLNLLGGLDEPTSGTISVDSQPLEQMSRRQLSTWRSQSVGFVFQFYNLMPTLNAQMNVELPLLLTPLCRRERRHRAAISLELVGLSERKNHLPRELSGGQQQRVAIARAIVSDPKFLICDEPTGDLDRDSATEIMAMLKQLNQQHGKTIIMVTHDPMAAAYADRSLRLDKGSTANQ